MNVELVYHLPKFENKSTINMITMHMDIIRVDFNPNFGASSLRKQW